MAGPARAVPRSGLARGCTLWYRTRTRFEKCMALGGLVLVAWACTIILTSSSTGDMTAPGLTQAEIQALRAQVKAQERAKFEEEKGKLLQDMMAREADVQARLKLAERQRQKLDESLIRARDANREDGAALSELEHKQALASEEIDTLRAELAALQEEAQAQVETRRSEMKSRIKQQTAASVARHAARKQAQHALERFCTATEEELAAASPVDTAVAVDSGACVGTALPVGDGMVAPSASDSDLPAVSVVRDAALAVRLASLVVPVLRNTTAAFNGKVVPIATHIATGRCCDEVTYASHPVHGAMYRMKLPVVSASDVVGGGRASGGADDDAAPVAYRAACFRRPWSVEAPAVVAVDEPQPPVRGPGGGGTAVATKRPRPSVSIIAVLGSRSSQQLPWLLRSLRAMNLHAARTRTHITPRLVLVVGRGPAEAVAGPPTQDAEPRFTAAEFEAHLARLRANVTTFGLGMEVDVIQPLPHAQRTPAGVLAATAGWGDSETSGTGTGAGDSPADGAGLWAGSPWVAAAVAGFAQLPGPDDIGVLLDPAALMVPDDMLQQVATRVKARVQVFAPVMQYLTAADAAAATVATRKAGVGAATTAATSPGGKRAAGGRLRAQTRAGAAATAEDDDGTSRREVAPFLTTLAASKRDAGAMLQELARQGGGDVGLGSGDAGGAAEAGAEAGAEAQGSEADASDERAVFAAAMASTGAIKGVDCAALRLLSTASSLGLHVVRAPIDGLLLAPGRRHSLVGVPRDPQTVLSTGLQDLKGMCGCGTGVSSDASQAGGIGASCTLPLFKTPLDGSGLAFQLACALKRDRDAGGGPGAVPGEPDLSAAALPRTNEVALVSPGAIHARFVDNVLRSSSFLDPWTGLVATGITSECALSSARPDTCPPPAATEHSKRAAVAPWVTARWRLSDEVIPQHSLLLPHHQGSSIDVSAASGSSSWADDDDVAAVAAAGGATVRGTSAGWRQWFEDAKSWATGGDGGEANAGGTDDTPTPVGGADASGNDTPTDD